MSVHFQNNYTYGEFSMRWGSATTTNRPLKTQVDIRTCTYEQKHIPKEHTQTQTTNKTLYITAMSVYVHSNGSLQSRRGKQLIVVHADGPEG